jgi:hypothetical protein
LDREGRLPLFQGVATVITFKPQEHPEWFEDTAAEAKDPQ